jgi:hypothetical protein
MNNDSDGADEWDDRGGLAWNEFDWERYLREQDEAVIQYLRYYESCRHSPDRIDAVAEKMGWGENDWHEEADDTSSEEESADEPAFDDDESVYTLHKNPIFIATKAIYLGLHRSWLPLASNSSKVPQPLAVLVLSSLQRGEEQAIHAIHALDFGDYAMAVSLFKRALSGLNGTLALLNSESIALHRHVMTWRRDAVPQLFDLREIWLRVMNECREELDRPVDDEN